MFAEMHGWGKRSRDQVNERATPIEWNIILDWTELATKYDRRMPFIDGLNHAIQNEQDEQPPSCLWTKAIRNYHHIFSITFFFFFLFRTSLRIDINKCPFSRRLHTFFHNLQPRKISPLHAIRIHADGFSFSFSQSIFLSLTLLYSRTIMRYDFRRVVCLC